MSVTRVVVFLCLWSGITGAESLTVALYEGANPPYSVIEDGKITGIFVDLFTQIEKLTPYHFEYRGYPFARALHEFDAGRVDIEPGINESWRQHAKVLGEYSVAYGVSREVIVFREKRRFSVTSPQDLFGESVGMVRGYSYPRYDEAFAAKKITRIDNLSESLLLRQLLYGRVEQIFIGYRTILFYKKMYPEYQSFVIGDVVGEAEVKLRVHPSKSYILADINDALSKLIESGSIEKIYAKYR